MTIVSELASTQQTPLNAKVRSPQAASTRSIVTSTLIAILAAAYFLGPIYVLICSATKSPGEVASTSALLPSGSFFTNLGSLVSAEDGIFVRWLGNTFLYAAVGGAVSTFVAAMAGYAIEKYVFPGKNFLYNLVLAGVLVPGAMLALPLFLLFNSMGLVNTVWAVLIPSLANPFGVYMARVFARATVPNEMLEAGRIDGASELRVFFTIALRLMSPGLITVFLFSFVSVWNNFMLPLLMLQDKKLYPVMLGIQGWSQQSNRLPEYQVLVVVGVLVAVLPVILMFLLMQRYWQSGLAAGAVKD